MTGWRRHIRQALPPLLLGLLVLTAVEGLCWAFFRVVHDASSAPRARGFDWERELGTLTDADLRSFRDGMHDELLGWDFPPSWRWQDRSWVYTTDALGARAQPNARDEVRISAYGDSFTFGDEVGDDETFPFYLSELTRTRVLNFGVHAYGPDQAILKLERNLERGLRTDVVILELITHSPSRVMNSYRPFLSPQLGFMKLAFKPVLEREGGTYRWLPNPLAGARGVEDLRPAFERAGEHNWFYQHRPPEVRFPYLVSALTLLAHRIELRLEGMPGWTHAEAQARVRYLLGRLEQLSERFHFVPVVVFVPLGEELARLEHEGVPPPYRGFVERLRAEQPGLIVVDVTEESFTPELFHRKRFWGHPSPYGNRVVAEAIHRRIVSRLD